MITKPETKFDLEAIRNEFPILNQKVNGQDLVYFDNAATSQKPKKVIQAIQDYYQNINANIHRGVHKLSQLATDAYEASRKTLQEHLNARFAHEIIFTTGASQGVNLVARAWGGKFLKSGDIILVSGMEHHSNIVPWQIIAQEKGAEVLPIPILESGELDLEAFHELLKKNPVLVAVNHVSNALGTINPVKEIIKLSHEKGALVLVDGAQSLPHMKIDVQDLNADFYVVSGHKAYGPTGSGALYGKEDLLKEMNPYMGGGEMISEVKFSGSTWADLPHKFEAGTPHIEGGIVLGKAIDWMNEIGLEEISRHENELLIYAQSKLNELEGFRPIGQAKNKASVLSFLMEGVHPYDLGMILDQLGIAVRTGHHCAQPVMDSYKIPGTIRASFAVYNTKAEIDRFVQGVQQACEMLR